VLVGELDHHEAVELEPIDAIGVISHLELGPVVAIAE
jgi:hypothetical protein